MSGRITAFGVCLDCWPVLPFALFVLFVTELCFSVCYTDPLESVVPAVWRGIQCYPELRW